MKGERSWHLSLVIAASIVGCTLLLLGRITQVSGHYYEPFPPIYYEPWRHYRLPPRPLLPVEMMTDAVNSMGTRVLQQYVDNGNVAFSPAGVGFILAALYEGSGGRSRQQISDCLAFPRDRNVIRMGFKDILNRLRTYLNPDGFLGGLNLNRENTQLRPDFEIVLQFYGFDLLSDSSNFTSNNGSNFGLKGSRATTLTPGSTTIPGNANAATLATTVPTTTTNAPTTIPPTTTPIDTSVIFVTTPPSTTTAAPPTTTTQATTTMIPATMAVAASDIVTVTTQAPTTMTTEETTTMRMRGELISSTLPRGTTQPTTDTTTNTMSPTTTGYTDYDDITFAEDIATVVPPAPITKRRRRSTDGYFSSFPDDGFWMQDLDIWPDQTALPTDQRDATELQFLVNGCEATNVPAATYTDVLPFAYFPSLKAVGLEFPLDNPRYNVLVLLPTERTDTNRLSRDLAGQNLRQLRKHLQPSWVRATIPSFMLRGFVTLTPYLQRLGIRDVFEPRLADLTPMTPDLGVYARDVQQSIAVNIKNYMKLDRENATNDNNATSNNGTSGQSTGPSTQPPRSAAFRFLRPANDLLDRMGLVTFTAGHPFLFFIVDSETSVSLIAGRIDNPLNSRIL